MGLIGKLATAVTTIKRDDK